MSRITSLGELRALYGAPNPNSLAKVAPKLTSAYADWIARSSFCLIATVGPGGTDVSPRGDDGPVVRIAAADRLEMPDWHGNNRVDTLENIVSDGRASLLFMVPGSDNVVRVNGTAYITAEKACLAPFERKGRLPRSVVVIEIGEVYFQCARALVRSGLWNRDDAEGLPTAGQMRAAARDDDFDAAAYDASWDPRNTLW